MEGKKEMLQNCMTELSELCSRLEKEFNLSKHSENGKIILQGDTYNITHGIEADGYEKICYIDNMASVTVSDDKHIVYLVKGKHLSSQKSILIETSLGQLISKEIDLIVARHNFTDEQKNKSRIKAEIMYQSKDEVYDLINSFIFA